jgi:hypothetical protein
MHDFAWYSSVLFIAVTPMLVSFSLGQAVALKAAHEAGRRGGDSIARRLNFILKK